MSYYSEPKSKLMFFVDNKKTKNNKLLGCFEGVIRFVETKVIIKVWLLFIGKTENYFFSTDSKSSVLYKKMGVKEIKPNYELSVKENSEIINKSLDIAKNWYKFPEFEKMIFYEGINLGDAIQQDFATNVFEKLKKLRVFFLILEENKPDIVFVDNIYSDDGKIIRAICKSRSIRCSNVYPVFYSKIKENIINYFKYTLFKHKFVDNVFLYKLEGRLGTKKIIFLAPYINYLSVMYPVLKKLMKRGITIFLMAKEEDIGKYDLDFKKIEIKNKDLLLKKDNLNQTLSSVYSLQSFKNLFEYLKIDLRAVFRDDIYFTLEKKIPALKKEVTKYKSAMNLINPDVVVSGDDRGPSTVRSDLLYSKKVRVPIVEIQHGIYSNNVPIATPISDKIFIWGKSTERVLIKAGANKENLVITGSPKFDYINEYHNLSVDENNNEKNVVFITQPVYENINYCLIKKVSAFLAKKNNINLIIKPHPSENYKNYIQLKKDLSLDNIIVKKENDVLPEIIQQSDAIILMNSSVGVEAAIFNKPMICINMDGITPVFVKEGVAIELADLDLIGNAIEKILYDKTLLKDLSNSRKRFLYNYVYIQDGVASDRIITNLLNVNH